MGFVVADYRYMRGGGWVENISYLGGVIIARGETFMSTAPIASRREGGVGGCKRYHLREVKLMVAQLSVLVCSISWIVPVLACCAEIPATASSTWHIICEDGRYWLAQGYRRLLWHGVNCVLPADGSEGPRYDVRARYGYELARWATAAWERITAWGFNGVGAWSADEIYALGVPHTRCAWLGGWGAAALVDVFSDEYEQRFAKTVQRDVIPYANEPGLVGFYCNNEMAWYGEYGWPTDPSRALLYQYCALPSNAPGKQMVVEFLRVHTSNDVATFNQHWAPALGSFDELLTRTQLQARTRHAKQMIFEWAGVVADRYFSMARAALRQHAPGKLFLGARFAGTAPRAVIEACGRYADVISINLYRKEGTVDVSFLDNVYALTRKPLLISEFSWRAMENASGNPNTRGADVTVSTQADRARNAEQFCRALAALPYVIGWDWFQYFDQPPGGRFDGENSNYGLVSIHDQPYRKLVRALQRVHASAVALHANSVHALPRRFDEKAWPEQRSVHVPAVPSGVKFNAVLLWQRLPTLSLETWGDEGGGARIAAQVTTNTVRITAEPAGWGCGCNLPLIGLPRNRDGSVNVRGAQYLVMRALVPLNTVVCLVLNESGAGPIGAQTYAGERGADGEVFLSLPLHGRGQWYTYVVDLRECELNTSYGNQRGNAILDTQALASVAIMLPGSQPRTELIIERVLFTALRRASRSIE
ncbi:MAG: hypothetical protein N2595_01540 [bacterium]|nr:hypothetical protein [bacterium]